MTVRWIALVVGVTSSLAACDFGLQNDQQGVTIDEDGRVHVLYLGCRDRQEQVESVEMLRVRGSLGGGDDEVVWRVHATGDDSDMNVIVGVAGDRYEEDVPLSEPLRGQYVIVVTTSLDDAAQGVDVARLQPGTIDTGLDMVSPAEFERQAMEACG